MHRFTTCPRAYISILFLLGFLLTYVLPPLQLLLRRSLLNPQRGVPNPVSSKRLFVGRLYKTDPMSQRIQALTGPGRQQLFRRGGVSADGPQGSCRGCQDIDVDLTGGTGRPG